MFQHLTRDLMVSLVVVGDGVEQQSLSLLIEQKVVEGFQRFAALLLGEHGQTLLGSRLMMEVHTEGRSVVWTGALEKAEIYAHKLHGCHLLATMERVGEE